eukprot:scaffold25307_cov168-Amphora_coffeaeformis.AAC.7
MSLTEDSAGENSITTAAVATTSSGTQSPPLFLAQQGDASLWLRYRNQDFAIIQISRGMGPRALEHWFQLHSDKVWQDDEDDEDDGGDTSDDDGINKGSITIRILTPHYRAYLQNIVLVARDKERAKRLQSFTITMHAIIQGVPQQSDLATLAEQNCHVAILRSSPSNTAGVLSLVCLTTSSPVTESKFFRNKLMDAGFPILGKAEGSRSFRGQRLLMSTVRLRAVFAKNPTVEAQSSNDNKGSRRFEVTLQDESPVSFAALLDKEERFWQQRHPTDDAAAATAVIALPQAYRDGHVTFGDIPIVVSPAVMIPRPGSLTLVKLAERLWRAEHPTAQEEAEEEAPVVLDLGTGSGCLLLALLQSFPRARGYGVDASAEALGVAQTNATQVLGPDRACHFVHARFTNVECPDHATLIVCNPPYHVPGRLLEAATLQHEPAEALFVEEGCDGLSSYREAWGAVTRLAAPGAVVVMEICRQNASTVYEYLHQEGGLQQVSMARDDKNCIRSIQGIYYPPITHQAHRDGFDFATFKL